MRFFLLIFLLTLSCSAASKKKGVLICDDIGVGNYEMSVQLKERTFDADKKELHVSGRVIDEKRNVGLSGANVVVKPDMIFRVLKGGMATDKDGWFNLQVTNVDSTDILAFSYIGYKSIDYSVRDIHRVSTDRFLEVPLVPVIVLDLNCDGIGDAVKGTIIGSEYVLTIMLQYLQVQDLRTVEKRFALSGAANQLSFCGTDIIITTEDSDYDARGRHSQAGFERSYECKGLRISDEVCAPIHIFWNHEENGLTYMRF